MSRIYLIITLCLFTFLACTNSANSNDEEEADTTEKSVNLENTVGRYQNLSGNPVGYSSDCGLSQSLEIIELTNNIYRCFISPLHQLPWENTSHCEITVDMNKIENGKWIGNEDGWYIVVPNKGFQKDLPSIVLAYEDSTGKVEAYPFYRRD